MSGQVWRIGSSLSRVAWTLAVVIVVASQAGCSGGGGGSNPPSPPVAKPPMVDTGLPPDPAAIAPAIDKATVSTVQAATAFLYTGSDPVQTGVAEGTIVERRAAVLRGRVRDRAGEPLPGVTVTVLDHPEFGQTLSRADGVFDLAVNGGGQLTVNYRKDGYLTIQRRVDAPWNDYAWLPDVTLVPLAAESAPLDLASGEPVQVLQGPRVSDARGERRATLLVPQGVAAQMVMPDGSTRAFSDTRLTVRATEYTVGDSGPEAMPGALPPGVAYTYALELTVDEALDAGASSVTFDRPLYQYVENFVGFPVGDVVPHYYYNRQAGRWERAEQDGRVIEILATDGGMASIDADGDGVAEDAAALAALGASDAELTRLAGLYQSGDTLWRVPVNHFSPHDLNWYRRQQRQLQQQLNNASANGNTNIGDPCASSGSIIECQNQVLGERIPVVGTPYTLNYRSSRTPGYTANRTLDLQLMPDSLPQGLLGVKVTISVAGQRSEAELDAQGGLSYRYVWDGLDAYGRPVVGPVEASIILDYRYTLAYMCNGDPCPVSPLPQTERVERSAVLGVLDARVAGLGGWTLSPRHVLSLGDLYRGDGRDRRMRAGPAPLDSELVAGGVSASGAFEGYNGDGILAVGAQLNSPQDVAVAPDGSLFIADTDNNRIRKVDPAGMIGTYAGGGDCTEDAEGNIAPDLDALGRWSPAWCDGGLATGMQLYEPKSIALGPDGSLYVADAAMARVLRIRPDGTVTSFAGIGEGGFSGDGGPATDARLNGPRGIEVGPDGSVYIADYNNHRVRKVGPDGIIHTIAGTGDYGYSGDGGPAVEAQLYQPIALVLGPDGGLYVADSRNNRVRRITPEGTIETVAGNGQFGRGGDAGSAVDAQVGRPVGLAVARDGTLFIASGYSPSSDGLRRVSPDGIITRIELPERFDDDDGPAGLAIAPDGALYVTGNDDDDEGYSAVYRLASGLPDSVDESATLIASDRADEVYRFEKGRHVATLSKRTGAELLGLAYDASGRLISLTDADGNVTRIEYDGSGNPQRIVAPGGQQTSLGVDSEGFLSRITNPAGEQWGFVYASGGLLAQSVDPNGGVSTYEYGEDGRLVGNRDPAGGGNTLAREEIINGHRVTRRSAEGIDYVYTVQNDATGSYTTYRDWRGITSTSTNGLGQHELNHPEGYSILFETARDGLRFGGQDPYISRLLLTTQDGLYTYEQSRSRGAMLTDWSDPLSVQTLSETLQDMISSSGRATTTWRYDVGSGEEVFITPMRRRQVTTHDGLGRVTGRQFADLAASRSDYDERGRLSAITVGTGSEARAYAFAYNDDNTLASLTDPSGAMARYSHDAAGRLTGLTRADGGTLGFEYDANGNLTGLTEAGGARHLMAYSGVNLLTRYTPPAVSGTGATEYAYDLDRRLTRIARPDGVNLDYRYDAEGRLNGWTDGSYGVTYVYSDQQVVQPTSLGVRKQEIDSEPAVTGVRLTGITTDAGDALLFDYSGPLLTSVEWTGEVSGRVQFGYDARLRPTSVKVGGLTVERVYEQTGLGWLPLAMGDLSVTRDATNGLITGSTLGGVTGTRSHNAFAELTGQDVVYGTDSLYSVSYRRDRLGRITEKIEAVAGETGATYGYAYDPAGRLVEVRKDGVVVERYAYDANGNRTSVANGAGSATASFDAQDRLLSQGGAGYAYTATGELSRKTVGSEATDYVYDAQGNLRRVDLPDGCSVSYVIDGLNRRIGKRIDGVLQRGWLYRDRLNPIAELDASGNVVSRFVYLSRDNVPDYMIRDGINYRIVSDHLGSVRLVVNASDGSIAQRIDYDAFGRVLSDSNPGFQPFGFAGGLYDPDTGLVRFGARDYDPDAGRWTAKDPLLFRGGAANLYGYVFNDPVNRIDPDGRLTAADLPGTVVVDGVIDLIDLSTGQNATNPANGPVTPGVPNGQLTPIGPTILPPLAPLAPLDPGIDLTDIFNRFYRSPC